ncbi:hypothetical protein H9P43_007558 [Blastocladiella emersonii ATCC 22665]|nr:hypothetical protein H9P43_007558 [Blastocladiella emersonii ATCC 22665]
MDIDCPEPGYCAEQYIHHYYHHGGSAMQASALPKQPAPAAVPRPPVPGAPPANDVRFLASMGSHYIPPVSTQEDDLSAMLTAFHLEQPARPAPSSASAPVYTGWRAVHSRSPPSTSTPVPAPAAPPAPTAVNYTLAQQISAMAIASSAATGQVPRGNGNGHGAPPAWLPLATGAPLPDPSYAPPDMAYTPQPITGAPPPFMSYIH